MQKTAEISVNELQAQAIDLVNQIVQGDRQIISIVQNDRKAAILMNPSSYMHLVDPVSRFSDSEWNDKFRFFENIKKRNKDVDATELENDLKKTLKDVRN